VTQPSHLSPAQPQKIIKNKKIEKIKKIGEIEK
jgi:hypothetical protein